ncbi:NADP-dependent oxidoreductase [Arthrobacter sp. NamB2]|uniref:NADP-dependent oxidoreductase n=1 Tax=Arthrobacter sp. NamB2 TaxID=2576035 RepID=UPI0010C96634|nr:NADP-dependent oxidoreductase [Arthrobacter sp. NamB2]TKV27866.1 NADP-dependent oxidoreductase [Arthrobacter sp. NamB2]
MPKAVRFSTYGGPDVLQVVDVPMPVPADGEVLVQVMAAALNPGEIGIREGVFAQIWPAHFPEGQGNDFSGHVVEVGGTGSAFAVGDEVLGFSPRAAQAEYVVVSSGVLAHKPATLSWEAAASVAGAGATAWASVAAVKPQPGETVVVSGAAGGVGIIAAQLARLSGATVIGTASSANAAALEDRGIVPVQYGQGLRAQLERMAPHGVDAFIDTFGRGNVALAIALGVPPNRINTTADGAGVQQYGVHSDAQEQADSPAIWGELAELAASGALDIPVGAVYPLERVADAYREVATRHGFGKRVLRIRP